MRSLIRSLIWLCVGLNSSAWAEDIRTKRYYVKGDFAFYEPLDIVTSGVGFYFRKVQTKLISKVEHLSLTGNGLDPENFALSMDFHA